MKRNSLSDRYCPIARSGAQLVDGWTLIILRDLLFGPKKFRDLEEQTGMSPRSLTLRLNALVEDDIIAKVKGEETGKRHAYKLTEKGRDLWPVIMTLKHWGERWNGPWVDDEAPVKTSHKGHEFHVEVSCSCCHEPVDMFSIESEMSKPLREDMEHMAKLYAERLKK